MFCNSENIEIETVAFLHDGFRVFPFHTVDQACIFIDLLAQSNSLNRLRIKALVVQYLLNCNQLVSWLLQWEMEDWDIVDVIPHPMGCGPDKAAARI